MDLSYPNRLSLWAHRLLLVLAVALATGTSAAPLRAEPVDDLLEALQIEEMLEIMRVEGMAYGEELAEDLIPGGHSPRWEGLLAQIYDPEKMHTVMRGSFAEIIAESDPAPLIAFFSSDLGKKVIQLELSARRAMIDDAVEEAARQTYRDLKGTDDARFKQIDRFIEVNDLLEANVTGALNASFRFYSGLVEGGGLGMSEAEILQDVWSQEQETRDDTQEWIYGFLLLAYEPLTDEELDAYIALSETSQGRALNRALFAGFNDMYDEVSFALGLAAAQMMQQQEL
ncbi:DUF2059 domain-containing protein [Antarctobacter jejuensis]|uniref:DUF2059 domain-containing protein n=1 Tax=Antarctobacter jejuensis TaxID=1439938 RepID=UPI003FD44961